VGTEAKKQHRQTFDNLLLLCKLQGNFNNLFKQRIDDNRFGSPAI
jgi:hypothetical protein